MNDEWGTIAYTDYQLRVILAVHTQRLKRGDLEAPQREILVARINDLKAEQARRQNQETGLVRRRNWKFWRK